VLVPPLLLLACAQTPEAALSFRVALGEEWDTNARRTITAGDVNVLPGASLPSGPVVGDGLTRLLADTQGVFRFGERHQLNLGYVLGAKRFYGYGSEDLLVHDLSFGTSHFLSSWLSLASWGTLRASRIRSGLRDYSLGTLGAGVYVRPIELFTIGVSGGLTGFDFVPERRLSFGAPSVGGEVTVRPIARLAFTARIDHIWRNYHGNALVLGQVGTGTNAVDRVVFCDATDRSTVDRCTPVARNDTEVAFALRGAYRGKVVIGGEYLLRVQRSTSRFEDIDRHRLSGFATFPLPFGFTANLLAALQINSGVSITGTKYVGEDDENQNSVQAQLGYDLSEELTAQLRYALFANQFSTAPVSFLRQTVYFGISYRMGT
jgi:hypothetical protein